MKEDPRPEEVELTEEDVNTDIFLPIGSKEEFAVFSPPVGYKGYFPPSAVAAHGCLNCTWRGTKQCPYRFAGGKIKQRKHPVWEEIDFPVNAKVDGICDYKRDYLTLLAGEWEKRPTYDIWQSRLMKNKGVIQNSVDEQEYLTVRLKLEEFQAYYDTHIDKLRVRLKASIGDKSEFQRIESDIKYLESELQAKKSEVQLKRQNFIQTWNILEGFFEKQVDRETPKKVEMEIDRKIRPMELGEIMKQARDKVTEIEATYEEVVSEDNKMKRNVSSQGEVVDEEDET